MTFLLANPLMLLGALLTLPALILIYFFRNKFRKRNVSGLFLWNAVNRTREGGTVIRRMRTSMLFWLEMLILIILAIAAASPLIPVKNVQRHLIVILDDSASMRSADKEENAKERALRHIKKIKKSGRFNSLHFLTAGSTVSRILSDRDNWSMDDLNEKWSCNSQRSDIDRALVTASAMLGSDIPVLIITDRKPGGDIPEKGRIKWRAFGAPHSNAALTAARRTRTADGDKLFIEVSNFSSEAKTIQMSVIPEYGAQYAVNLSIPPGSAERRRMKLPKEAGPVTLSIPDDALDIDNTATLLPDEEITIGIRTDISDETIREYVSDAVGAMKQSDTAPSSLLITDKPEVSTTSREWILQLHCSGPAKALQGPFVIDSNHPLLEGISPGGVIWGASAASTLPGEPILLANEIELISHERFMITRHKLHMQWVPEMSNLQKHPVWPSIIWNLIRWRQSELPGIQERNISIGVPIEGRAYDSILPAEMTAPDGVKTVRKTVNSRFIFDTALPGIHTVANGALSEKISVNFFSSGESDTRILTKGEWGSWNDNAIEERSFSRLAWIFALAALILLLLHSAATARTSRRGDNE